MRIRVHQTPHMKKLTLPYIRNVLATTIEFPYNVFSYNDSLITMTLFVSSSRIPIFYMHSRSAITLLAYSNAFSLFPQNLLLLYNGNCKFFLLFKV